MAFRPKTRAQGLYPLVARVCCFCPISVPSRWRLSSLFSLVADALYVEDKEFRIHLRKCLRLWKVNAPNR